MRLTRFGYYSDFAVYPVFVVCLAALGLYSSNAKDAFVWAVICFGSVVAWTLIEYGLHRFVFHRVPFFRQLHQQHHDEERSLLGTPVWLSLLAHLFLVFLPALFMWNMATASAISCGVMFGYLWYVGVHHMLHHRHTSHDGYLYWLKRRHAVHHHISEHFNFGVTTDVWDRVFRTVAPELSGRNQLEIA